MTEKTTIKLKACRPLFDAIEQLDPDEAAELKAFLRSLLDQPTDSVIEVTKFVKLAREFERLSLKRSQECQSKVKAAIQKILREC